MIAGVELRKQEIEVIRRIIDDLEEPEQIVILSRVHKNEIVWMSKKLNMQMIAVIDKHDGDFVISPFGEDDDEN